MKTLLIGNIHPEAENLLQIGIDLQKVSQEQFEQTDYLPEIEAVILRTFTQFKTAELAKFPHLKWVISCSVGLDNLNLGGLKEKGIELIHCPGTNANSVAEHTLYLIFSLLRKDPKKPFVELKDKTVGIIGLGYIGKLVARKLKGLEVKTIAFDVIEQNPEVLEQLQVEMKDFNEVLEKADIVTVHVPYNKHTEKLISSEAFTKMKQDAFFINTSRAEIIDEEALIQLSDKFRGIALDVYSDNLKEKLKGNIVLSGHVAAQGEESFRKMCLDPIKEFLKRI